MKLQMKDSLRLLPLCCFYVVLHMCCAEKVLLLMAKLLHSFGDIIIDCAHVEVAQPPAGTFPKISLAPPHEGMITSDANGSKCM